LIDSLRIENRMLRNVLLKNKKISVVEYLYDDYFSSAVEDTSEELLKELVVFFHREIEVEDLICFMANVYPNYPRLRDTILYDLLKLYEFSTVDWNLVKYHFKYGRKDLENIVVKF
jgi:hypothetical protein